MQTRRNIIIVLLILTTVTVAVTARPFVLVLSSEDLKDTPPSPDDESSSSSSTVADWDDFNESSATSDDDLDPGSWRPIFEPNDDDVIDDVNASYYKSVSEMIDAASVGEKTMEDVVKEIDEARGGHALSLLGFCYGLGIGKERNSAKAFMYHYFAAEAGNMQ
ncbi:hypothetical protein Tco_1347928, partial [Tanacetum coccineum]